MSDMGETDFAVIVYREEDQWEADALPATLTADLDGLVHALRRQPSMGGTIGFAGVGDDFWLAVRIIGEDVSLFLSDLTAAADYPLARQVLEALNIPVPSDDELDQVLPAVICPSSPISGWRRWNSAPSRPISISTPRTPWPASPNACGSGKRWSRPWIVRSARDRLYRGLRARDAAALAEAIQAGPELAGTGQDDVPVGAVILDEAGTVFARAHGAHLVGGCRRADRIARADGLEIRAEDTHRGRHRGRLYPHDP